MESEPAAKKDRNYWTLDKVASLIAIGTFLFGVGSVAQAVGLFSGTTQRRLEQQEQQQFDAQETQAQQRNERISQIDDYIRRADSACQSAVGQDTDRPATYDYQADLRISSLRIQMLDSWESVPYGALPADEIPVVRKIFLEFEAANDYWAAVTAAFSARNIGVEDTALGQFTSAEGAFETDAAQFGFEVCDHSWPNLNPN